MKIDWKLTGNNLFHFNCSKDAVIHPETCITQVLTTHDGNSSLYDWITTDSDNTSYELKPSLMDWLQTYYSLSTQLGFTGYPGLDDNNSIILGTISVGDDPTVYMRAPFGSGDTAGVLQVNTSNGLAVTNGIININRASNSSFGVIKTNYIASGNNKPVLLDNNGNAYVDISGGTAQATIGGWNFNGTIAELDPAPIMYFNTGDAFASINLSNYVSQITSIFTGTPDSYKFYPVRTDIDGRAYVYVPWNSATYGTFTSSVDGLVPASGISSNKQYLRADGTWGEVPYPSRFTLNKDGLVNYPTAANQYNFLRGDGSWQNVTEKFKGATTTQNGVIGMVPAPTVADKEKFLKGDGTWSPVVNTVNYVTESITIETQAVTKNIADQTRYDFTTVDGGNTGVLNLKLSNAANNATINIDNSAETAFKMFLKKEDDSSLDTSIVFTTNGMSIIDAGEVDIATTDTRIVINICHRIAYVYVKSNA